MSRWDRIAGFSVLLFMTLPNLGCGGQPGQSSDLLPLSGQTRAALSVAKQPAWQHSFATSGYALEAGRETARAAFDPKTQLLWIGTSRSTFKCINAISSETIWEKEIPGGIRGEAVWHEGMVFTGTEGGRFIALDARSGKQIWSYPVQAAVRKMPLIAGDLIVFVDGANTVVALNHRTGEWKWQYRRDPPKDFALVGEGRPTLIDGRVHLGFSDGYHVALGASDGTLSWTRQLSKPGDKFQDADAQAVFLDGVLYVSAVTGALHALDPSTGKPKWTLELGGALQLAAFDNDIIVAQEGGRLLRVDTYAKKKVWQVRLNQGWGSPSGIEVSGNNLVVGWSKGGLSWIDGRTGRPQLQFDAGTGFSARPLSTDDGLYALGNQGTLFAFRAEQYRRSVRKTPLTSSPGRGLQRP